MSNQVKFKKFSSLENSYRENFIHKIREQGYENEYYIITEKLHGCFTHDTKITLPDGKHKTIGEIVEEKYDGYVLGVDKNGEVTQTKVLNWFNNGTTEDWLKITVQTYGGKGGRTRVLKVTPNHKFFCDGEYKAIKDLSIGDKLEYTYEGLKPSKLQEQVMIGKMLGDGCLVRSAISFGHTKEKEDYTDFTMKCLGSFTGNRQKDIISGYGSVISRGRSISSPYVDDIFKDWDKPNGYVPRLTLTPISLLFWYLDDGSISVVDAQKARATFSTCAFSIESCNNLLKSLNRLGLFGSFNINGYTRITLDTESTELLFSMISTLVPKCMQYKLPEHFRIDGGGNGLLKSSEHDLKQRKSNAVIRNIEKLNMVSDKYDIETETHNYFANNIHVHNSNYSFTVVVENGLPISVIPAKRSGYIHSDEKFYNHRPVYEKYVDKVSNLALCLLKDKNMSDGVVTVYGELYGGNIQGGMAYPLEQDFAGFDISIDGQPINKLTAFSAMFADSIPTVPVVGFTDTLSEALELNESFVTKRLREDFDVANPQSEAEGIVIEPVNPRYLTTGERVYIKKKTKRFLEKGKNNIKKPEVKLNNLLSEILEKSLEYVNENRYNAVVSKEGDVNIKMIGKISGLMTQDIITDLIKDGVFEELKDLGDASDVKKFKQTLQSEVINFIRPILLKIDV